ncbi:MAG: DUF4493 domain-containing protein [Candidatus Cryptobacteroides sp.]
MKKYIIYIVVLSASLLLAGCKKSVQGPAQGFGKVAFSLTAKGEYETKASEVDVNLFTVKITRPSDGWTKSFDSFGSMPQAIELPEASYTVEVSSPDALPAAFDQPVYGAMANFAVRVGETVPVSLTATLQNMMVTLNPDSNFLTELSSFTVTISNGEGADHSLSWTTTDIKNGPKDGYFSVAPLSIHVDGYRAIDGAYASFDGRITDVAARDHHIINLSAKTTGQVGGITITVDYTTNDKTSDVTVPGLDEIPVDGPDPGTDPDPEPEPEPGVKAPSLEWPANPSFAPVPITDNVDADLVVKAPGVIKNFLVTVSDNFKPAIAVIASEDGSVTEMDLINNEYLITMLSSVAPSLPTGNALKGQTVVDFPLSALVPMIAGVGSSGEDYIFTLHVTDELGQTLVKSLTFYLE